VRRFAQWLLAAALGGDAERRVSPVVAVSFIYSASFSTFWVYVGVYAVKGLGWRPSQVGLLFLLAAPVAAIANYLSGHISDRVGRRPLIVASFLASSANVTALSVLGHTTAIAFALIVAQGVIGAPAYSLDRVLVADLVADADGREAAYATVRVATNLGAFLGPPLGALLIHLGGWRSFLWGAAALGLVGAAAALGFLPATGGSTRRGHTDGGSLRVLARDRPFALLLLSTLLGFFVFCGFETVLPVIAVSSYGMSPSTWGVLVVISPLLVVFFQLRLTRAVSRVPVAARLTAALLVMGLPFLALVADQEVAVIGAVIAVFVVGEMVWMPTSQTVAARLAPAPSRGTYFGALAAMTGPAWTLAPFIALQLRTHIGAGSVWIFFAVIGVAGAVAGLAAVRAADSQLGSSSGLPTMGRCSGRYASPTSSSSTGPSSSSTPG
jgi:DHA1 family multidrug resistance protein-like MFS transporter